MGSTGIFNPGGGAGAGTVTNTGDLTLETVLVGNSGVDAKASKLLVTEPTTATTLVFSTDNAVLTFQGTGTVVNKDSTDVLTNKTLDTAGAGNILKINGTAISDKTGTGKVVLDTSPTLVTPVLGVATATSINKVAFTAPTTAATFAFGTDNTTQTFQGTGTIVNRTSTDTLTNKTLDTATNTFLTNGQSRLAILASDYTNATTSVTDVTGLAFNIEANKNYALVCYVAYSVSASTATPNWQFTGPASPTSVLLLGTQNGTTLAGVVQIPLVTAFSSLTTTSTTTSNTGNCSGIIICLIRNGANAGTVQLQAAAHGVGTLTIMAGSSMLLSGA